MIKACMGGFCALRDRCPNFHAEFRGSPNERLCLPGKDGESDVALVSLPESRFSTEPMPSASSLPSQQVNA